MNNKTITVMLPRESSSVLRNSTDGILPIFNPNALQEMAIKARYDMLNKELIKLEEVKEEKSKNKI